MHICIFQILENRTSKEFLNAAYKCDKCIKGFTLKVAYERHLDKHKNVNIYILFITECMYINIIYYMYFI